MKRKDQDIRRKKKTQWEANGLKRGDSSVMGVPNEVKKEKRRKGSYDSRTEWKRDFVSLFGPGPQQNDGNGSQEYFKIEPQRPVINVLKIQPDPVFKVLYVISAGNLPQASQAGSDA